MPLDRLSSPHTKCGSVREMGDEGGEAAEGVQFIPTSSDEAASGFRKQRIPAERRDMGHKHNAAPFGLIDREAGRGNRKGELQFVR